MYVGGAVLYSSRQPLTSDIELLLRFKVYALFFPYTHAWGRSWASAHIKFSKLSMLENIVFQLL